MSSNIYAHEAGFDSDSGPSSDGNIFQRVVLMQSDFRNTARTQHVYARNQGASQDSRLRPCVYKPETSIDIFKTVRPNIVQSIRAFRVVDLADEALRLEQHFLYASCAHAQTKNEVLEIVASSFLLPRYCGKNFDALFDSLTDLLIKTGEQPGFVVVLEGLPVAAKFDKEARETLLDVFREAAEFWAEHKVMFRVFYSFS